jgi:hypothetical protein
MEFASAGPISSSANTAPVQGFAGQLTPGLLRLLSAAALLVAVGSLLAARRGSWSAHEAGLALAIFAAAMMALHLWSLRTAGPVPVPADAQLAALLAAAATVPAAVLLFWQRAGVDATQFLLFGIDNNGGSNAMLASAAVFLAAFALGRHPRWLLPLPLVLVAGIELRLTSGGEVSAGGGDWTRFCVLVLAIAVVVAVGRGLGGARERNLMVAAALLAPVAFLSVPTSAGRNGWRDLIGAAMLAILAVLLRRRVTPGAGFGMLLLALLEVESLADHGDSLAPPLLFGLAGLSLLALSLVAQRRGQPPIAPVPPPGPPPDQASA